MDCPLCGTAGKKVPEKTVYKLVNASEAKRYIPGKEYFICGSPGCKIAYFNDKVVFAEDQLQVKIWYKHDGDGVVICYCSNITRGEIKNAVMNGCKTIADVHRFTGKNIKGQCVEKNPEGHCCGAAFLKEIEKEIAMYSH